MSNQYILILNQNQRITTYRCEHINYLIKATIEEIFNSYNLEPSELTSEDFEFQDFRDLYDLEHFESKSLKELFEFFEKIKNDKITLNDKSIYEFNSNHEFPQYYNIKWSLKIEPKYGSLIIHGFTNVDKQYPTNFHIEKI